MLEEKIEYKIDELKLVEKTLSIAKDIIIKKDGIEIARNRHRCAFVPGQLELVKQYLGITESPEISYLESIWTQEVIDAYNASIN